MSQHEAGHSGKGIDLRVKANRDERKRRLREILECRRLRELQGEMTYKEKLRFFQLDSMRRDGSVKFTEDMIHEFEGLYELAKSEKLKGYDWSNCEGVFVSRASSELNRGYHIDPAYGFWWN